MTKRTKISQATKTLTAQGFVPVQGSGKAAGAVRKWTHADGRKVTLDYGLYSQTGQSSLGMAASWGHFITEDRT